MGPSWHGPFEVLGDPCPDDKSQTTYHAQISSVFKVPGKKDLYIACGDRWAPGEMNLQYQDYKQNFEAIFNPEADQSCLKPTGHSDQALNTSLADYVWLPFRFDGDMAYLDWKDEWRIEEYE